MPAAALPFIWGAIGTAGGMTAAAALQAHSAGNAAKRQTAAANYAADREAQSAAAALQFQKDEAARDQANAEKTQRENYEQWAARQRRLSSFYSDYLGIPAREIPAYGSTGAPTGGTATTPTGDIPKTTGDVAKDMALANELTGSNHTDPSYWVNAGYARDPQYFFQKMLGMDAGGADKPLKGPYAGTTTSTPKPTSAVAANTTDSTSAPLGRYTSLVRTPRLVPSWQTDASSTTRSLSSYL